LKIKDYILNIIMSDIYGTTNALAIQQGNARLQEVRELNERIKEHNADVATTIQGLREQAQTSETIQQVKDQGQALWAGARMPSKIKAYNQWKAARNATNPTASAVKNQTQTVTKNTTPTTEPQETSGPAPEAVEEGGLGRSAGEAAESATEDISKDLGGKLASVGSKAGEEVAETLAGKAAGLAGGLMGAAQGGIDIYEDIKSIGSGHGIAGNNNWEKAGNLLQIGGSIADIVGMAFPPAALLGGVLDLASGATDAVGEKLDADKKSKDLTQEQKQDTEKPVTVSSSSPSLPPAPVATTALTAVTQRLQ
jgi:hypothetical protein